jgi:predicted ester cyclase
MSEANKQLVRRLYDEVENQLKLNVADEIIAPEFKDTYNTAAPFPVVGIDGIKKLAQALHDAMDMHITVEDLIAEGDRVVARISAETTHKVPMFGVAPTGKRSKGAGVEIWRVANGKLAERWVFIDMLAMMQQLGAAVPH